MVNGDRVVMDSNEPAVLVVMHLHTEVTDLDATGPASAPLPRGDTVVVTFNPHTGDIEDIGLSPGPTPVIHGASYGVLPGRF